MATGILGQNSVFGYSPVRIKTPLPCVIEGCGKLTWLILVDLQGTNVSGIDDNGDQLGFIVYPVCPLCLRGFEVLFESWRVGVDRGLKNE
jgi:hypothetical protein